MSKATSPPLEPRRQRGVSLIEALIAMLVMAVGMVGFAAMQAKLRTNSDVAKQRSEAVRMAQEDIENLRAYGTLVANAALANNLSYGAVESLAAQKSVLATTVVTATNAVYTITRQVQDSTRADMKDLRVQVAWTNREGAAEQVVLRSLIARADPLLAAAMSIAPNGSPVRDALGRDIQVPIPAKNLGNNTSVYKPISNGTTAFVFSNDTGLITKKCANVSSSAATASLTTENLGTCTDINAMLLSGYVRFSLGNNPNATTPNDVPPGGLSINLNLDSSPIEAANAPLGTLGRLNTSYWSPTAPSGAGYTTPECASEYSKTVIYTQAVSYSQVNNNVTQTVTSAKVVLILPAATPLTAAAIQPYTTLTSSAADLARISDVTDGGERFIAYTCVVYPMTLNGVLAWSGRSTIQPSGWTLGTTASTYKVCRYSNDANLDGSVWLPSVPPATNTGTKMTKIDNAEHPNAYIWVQGSLSNQNFLVVAGNQNCPTDGPIEVDGQGQENYTDETTVTHQS